ncbi:MAG: hypothetical protein ABW212_07505, partial [Pseudonocardia sediminis]
HYDRDAVLDGMAAFVETVERMEAEVDGPEAYRAAAKDLVRRYLPEGAERQRFSFTPDQELLLRGSGIRDLDALRFGDAEL